MAVTPAATATGPIPATTASTPFRSRGGEAGPGPGPGLVLSELDEVGYVEEEYFISGTADGAAYDTVLQVRMPSDPSAFSGVVLFETLHAAGLAPLWGNVRHLLGQDHGYAMVVSQTHSLDTHVKPSNPERYVTCDIAVPDVDLTRFEGAFAGVEMPSEIRRQMVLLGAQAGSSNAIMSQAAALLKRHSPGGPFAGRDVRHVILGGASQTAATTLGFIRNAQLSARLEDGSPVFDGFMPASGGGTEPIGPCDVPVIEALGESEMLGGRPLGYRRPDGDGPTDRYRLYEFTAVSHVSTRGVQDPVQAYPSLAGTMSPDDIVSRVPGRMLYVAALHNLIQWVVDGTPAPRGERIETDAQGEIVRDEHGNACGGVRLSHVDVPIATYIAKAPGREGFGGIIGLEVPFSKDKLVGLYGTHERYVELVCESLDRLVAERWLLPDDADELRSEAERSDVP